MVSVAPLRIRIFAPTMCGLAAAVHVESAVMSAVCTDEKTRIVGSGTEVTGALLIVAPIVVALPAVRPVNVAV
jgi:hypothetical protein